MDPIDTHHELEDGQSFDAIVAYKIKGHICYEGNKRHLEKSNLFPKLLTTNIKLRLLMDQIVLVGGLKQ